MSASSSGNPAFTVFSCQSCGVSIKQLEPSLLDGTYFEALVAPLGEGNLDRTRSPAVPSPSSAGEAGVLDLPNADIDEDANQSKEGDEQPVSGHGDSFIVLSRSGRLPPPTQVSAPPSTLSYRLRVAAKMFDVINGKSDFDHPLCQDCADLLLEKLDRRLADITREHDTYVAFLKELELRKLQDSERGSLTKIEEETDTVRHIGYSRRERSLSE